MGIIKKAFPAIFIAGFFSANLIAQNNHNNLLPQNFDLYVAKVMKEFEVPGMAIGVVKDGKVILEKGYGIKEIGKKEKVDANTLFPIASNSKAFTATALALLVEEGKLEWDAPVLNYLPWFRLSDS